MSFWVIINFSFWNTFYLRTWHTVPAVMLCSLNSKHLTKNGCIYRIRYNIFQLWTDDIFIPTYFNFIQRVNREIIVFAWFINIDTNWRANTINKFFTLNKMIFTISPSQVEHKSFVNFLRHIKESSCCSFPNGIILDDILNFCRKLTFLLRSQNFYLSSMSSLQIRCTLNDTP